MKNIPFLFFALLFIQCNQTTVKKKDNKVETTQVVTNISTAQKTEMVTYYLLNGKKLAKKDFYKIIFLNDNTDNVKVIHYKDKASFFTFPFSKALKFYKTHKNNK